jgi:hypothetical protein
VYGGGGVSCLSPIDAAVLADYWLAALAGSEEEAIELHLLDCDECGEDGLRIREYALPAGGGVQCTVTAEDDFLIGRLAANLTGAKRVDLYLCDERGVEQMRMADIPIPQEASGVVYQESITWAKAMPTSKMIARLVTFDESGGERLLGEYTFNHTRSMPGPGAWPPVT